MGESGLQAGVVLACILGVVIATGIVMACFKMRKELALRVKSGDTRNRVLRLSFKQDKLMNKAAGSMEAEDATKNTEDDISVVEQQMSSPFDVNEYLRLPAFQHHTTRSQV
eukprot:m.87129 g.87129  ORF g.87129 m.87129 type:complete len:111 (-) comp16395_c0_seq1:78-410(-)